MSDGSAAAGAAGGGLVGALVGAVLQYYVGDKLETQKQRLQIQITAYSDLAKGQAALQRAQAAKDKDEANLRIRDAGFRLAIFSPGDVVKSYAAFVREKHPEMCTTATSPADIAVYQNLRREVSDQNVSNDDLTMAIFACKPK